MVGLNSRVCVYLQDVKDECVLSLVQPFFQPIIYYKISKMRQKSFEVLDNVFGHFSNELLYL
jgi:hypothetical protein